MPDPVLLVEDKGVLREMFGGALASAGCRGLGRHRVALLRSRKFLQRRGLKEHLLIRLGQSRN